jgi:hypothetical protein
VIEELTRLRLLDKALAVRGISWWTDDDEGIDYTIVWPRDHDRELSIW